MMVDDQLGAVVTGAAGAIGGAISQALADAGYVVVLLDIDRDGLEAKAREIGGETLVRRCDMSDRKAIDDVLNRLDDEPLNVNCLVNAVGIAGRGHIDEVEGSLWDEVIAINLSSVFWSSRWAVSRFRRAQGGTIVNIASIAGVREQASSPIYSASKGGVVMFSRSLAASLASEHIRVFAVCPPPVSTPLLDGLFADFADPAAAKAEYAAQLPGGRLIEPEEIAIVVRDLVLSPPPYSPEHLVS